MRILLLLILGILVMIPSASYSESNNILAGKGYGTIQNNVEIVSLEISMQISDVGKSVFQNGKIVFGDESHSITNLNISLLNNNKSMKLDAETDDFTINASGRLVMSIDTDSVYQLLGKTSNNDTFSIFVRLTQDQTTKLDPTDSTKNPLATKEFGAGGILGSVDPPKKDLLLLVKQVDRVEWKSPYKFTIRTFDPKSNPLSDFYSTSGYVEGVHLSITVTNSAGDIIKTSNGITQKFGYYEDSMIIPDNARTGIYTLSISTSGKDYQFTTRESTFVVSPISSGSASQ